MKSVIAALVALLGGCALAPPFEQPAVEVPVAYKEADQPAGAWKTAEPQDALARGAWWEVFGDPQLNELVATVEADNQDLREALARLDASRAGLQLARAPQLPSVDFGSSVLRAQPGSVQPGLTPGTPLDPYTRYQAGLRAGYEVDLFGRIRDGVRAASDDVAAESALYHALLLSLQADVAENYFLVRATDAELEVLRLTVRLREEAVRLFEQRLSAGDISELDLARARAELELSRSDVAALERQRARYEHALAVLLGRAPASFALAPVPAQVAPPAIPPGVPSTLLERRPDIAAAQRRMTAANARIGIARAAFYPVLSLGAEFGLESGSAGDLFKWASRTWALGPLGGAMLALPLFDGGRNRANLARAEADLDAEIARYRQTVLRAFAEVEDQLVDLRTLAAQSGAIGAADVAAMRAVTVANVRFDAGATGYLDVLDSRRTLVTVQRQQAQIDGARSVATVGLVRALGGGW